MSDGGRDIENGDELFAETAMPGIYTLAVLQDGDVIQAQPFVVNLFAPEESEIARDFAAYRPIPFARPPKQRIADAANLAGLGGVALYLVLYAARRWRRLGE